MNPVEIEQAISALAEQPFDPAEFPYLFLQAFGNKETTLKRLRKGESNKSDLGGVLQTSNIHIAVAPHGEVTKMLAKLKVSPATAKAKAKFVLATDGDTFEAEDLTSGETIVCAYNDFPDHFGFFLSLAGITTVEQLRESSFDIRATTSRRISEPTAGPLFAGESEDGDLESGTIYVLRSKSDNPVIAAHRDVLHKIGVTGGNVEARIANAQLDPTFLMADVEIVVTYKLSNINRTKLENLIHRIFDPARLEIEIKDRFGLPIIPREWFLLPVFVIDEAVERIKDGSITDYIYDPQTASLVRREH